MANPLIPEVRVNKNGVPVTRHVRSGDRQNKPLNAPAPSVSGNPSPRSSKAAEKPLKLRPKQLEQRMHSFSAFRSEHDRAIRVLRPSATPNYKFKANAKEVYDVMSVTTPGNAFVLLESGVRTREDALRQLQQVGLKPQDNIELMQELLKRNISPEAAAHGINNIEMVPRLDRSAESSAHHADAIEYSAISSFQNMIGTTVIHRRVLNGEISVADIKAVGAARMRKQDRIYDLQETFARMQEGTTSVTTKDLKEFVDICNGEDVPQDYFKDSLPLLEQFGMEAIDKLESIRSYPAARSLLYSNVPANQTEEAKKKEVERSYYAAQLIEALERNGEQSGRYWAQQFAGDATNLYAAEVDIDEAVRMMDEGYTAQQIIGQKNGIESGLSDGWL